MKKILKYSLLAVLALSMAAFVSCKKQELDTNQFSGFSVAAVDPNPVMRGAVLRIVGSNLENASEVQLAGGVSITDIEVVAKGSRSEIRVTVPMEGPEVGLVTVKSKDGLTASSKFDLEFTEPIELYSFSPATARSGEVITLKGEYLNNVLCVIFGGDVKTNEFISKSRSELSLYLPADALTGPVIVSDVDEVNDQTTIPNQIYSEGELIVGAPTVTKAAKATYKSGDLITVTGEHLDMIKQVDVGGVSDVDFTVAEDLASLSFYLPAAATDGNITLTSYAGDSFDGGEIETVSVSDLSIASLADDGRYKAGTQVEITGGDLDLVESVAFTNADASWYYSSGKIYATVPQAAKDGAVTVTLGSGKQAVTDAIEVVKPVVTGVDANTGIAGQSVIAVSGTDLDLVTLAEIGNEAQSFITCDFVQATAEDGSIRLDVTLAEQAYTGPIVLTAASGYTSETEIITVTYDNAVSIQFAEESFGLGRPITITGENLLKIEALYIKGNKVPSYSVRTDTEMVFTMPDGIGPGVYRLGVQLVDGTEIVWPVPFAITAPYTETYIWEGYEDMGTWSNQAYLGADGAFIAAGLVIGDQVRVYYTPKAEWWQFQIYGGHWEGMSFPELGGGNTVSAENTQPDATYFTFEVTEDNYGILCSQQYWGGALLTQGENVIITGLSMIHFGATETVVWEGSRETGDYATNLELGGEDDWVNNELWEGAEVRIYFTPADPADWSLQIFDGHWGSLSYVTPNGVQWNQDNAADAIEKGYVSFKAEGAAFAALTSHQWWGSAMIIQGKNLTVTKLAFI